MAEDGAVTAARELQPRYSAAARHFHWLTAEALFVHWLLYGLLLIVPLLGWIGVSLYPSLTLFMLFDLPALTTPNEALANAGLRVHGNLAIVTALLAAVHIAAALHHHFVRRDGVLRRMLPGPN